MTEPVEIPPIVAVVQIGDALTFLMPQLADLTIYQLNHVREILRAQHPGINVQVVPAVGVVHIPAPEQVIVDPDRLSALEIANRLNVCTSMYGHPNMRGFRLCASQGEHEGDHQDVFGFAWPRAGTD